MRREKNTLTVVGFSILWQKITFPEVFRYNFTCSCHSKMDIWAKDILSPPLMHQDVTEEVWTVAVDIWRWWAPHDFFFFFLFSFSFTVCMSGFNQSVLCEMFQLGLKKLFALLWYGPVDYRWNYIKRLQRLITPESFQCSPHQLTLSAHYINNLGEAIISKAWELHLPSPCTCIWKLSYMLVHFAWLIYA